MRHPVRRLLGPVMGAVPSLSSLFGTDGVRGVANGDLTPELAFKVGRSGAHSLASQAAGDRPFLVLGRDTRVSGDLLTAAVTAGICSVGVDVIDLGVIPTPGVAYLVRRLGAAGGAVISASHNPVDDNGIKFFDRFGYKLTDQVEHEIETMIRARQDRLPRPVGISIGRRLDGMDHVATYIDHLQATADGDLRGSRLVLDAAFGATAGLATEVMQRLGCEVVSLNDIPDGSRINVDCGSTNPEAVSARVVEISAAAGLAFDGDGDRVIAVDERGQVVDGDQVMAILALDLIARKALPKKTLVATVMSNLGLDLALRDRGGRVIRTPVGDRSVLQAMLEQELVLGGEQSGHIILLRHNTTGDGIAAGIALLTAVARAGRPLSELAARVAKVPQVLVNVQVERKDKLETSEKVATAIERVRESLGHAGRVLVRPSGTEPLVRIMIEGRDAGRIRDMAHELAAVVTSELGGEILG